MAPRRILFLVLASSVAAPAAGAELYRCVAAGGAVSFQDAPCAGDSRLSRTIPIQVDPRPVDAHGESEARAQTGSGKPKKATKAKGTASKAGAAKSGSKASDKRDKQRSACTKARKDRDAAVERLGLNRTFEQLQVLDHEVQEVCKRL